MRLFYDSPVKTFMDHDGTYDMSMFEVGDRLRTNHFYWHEGIYVGPVGPNGESVVHNDFDAKQVILNHPEDYTRKARPIFLHERTEPERQQEVADRALRMLGTPFDLIRFNCQHFASYAQHGVATSHRVKSAAFSIGVVVLIAVVILLVVAGLKRQKRLELPSARELSLPPI